MNITVLEPREGSGCNPISLATCAAADGSMFKGTVYHLDGQDVYNGTLKWPNGREFVGRVNEEGAPITGRMTSPDGNVYDGTFNGWGEDEGKLVYANGDTFIGKFMYFVPTDGVMTYAPRTVRMVNGEEVKTGEKVEPAQKWQWDMGYN